MQDFERFTGSNLGGFREFEVSPMNNFETIPTTSNGSCLSAVTFKTGKRWYKAYSTPETIEVKESAKKSGAGTIYQRQVNSFYPKQTPAALSNLIEMKNSGRIAVLITDNNGNKKLFLNMRFSFTPISQKSVNKRAGYALNFSLGAIDPAPFYPF